MLRKLALAFLLMLLLMALAEGAAAQSPSALIIVDDACDNPGATSISIPVRLVSQNGAQVSSMNFDIGFNTAQLTLSNVTPGTAAAGKTLEWSTPSSGTVRVIVYGGISLMPNGTLGSLIFDPAVGSPERGAGFRARAAAC